jgi:F-type H+-transporting ATPase subunit b
MKMNQLFRGSRAMALTTTMTVAFSFLAIILLPLVSMAEEHEAAHEGGGLPSVVYFQAINFVLFAGLLVYLGRKPIRDYFSGRKEKFNAALTKAAAAKSEAEARKQEIQKKINDLQASSEQELARAKSEAQDLHTRILKEAEGLSENLRVEAKRTATFEIERAKNELRESLLSQSVAFSSKLLREKIAEGDQKRLQTEFSESVSKIGANR